MTIHLPTYRHRSLEQVLAIRSLYAQGKLQQLLTPRELLCVELYYIRQCSMPQISRQLYLHPSTISRTLARAEGRIRTWEEDERDKKSLL